MILGFDPKVDYAFKYMLGRESTRAILIDVLNNVLKPSPGHEIVDVELLEELKMLTQTDIERERYESRRKAQMDHNSFLNSARRQGEMTGKIIGERIGAIHICERMLRRQETPEEHLLTLSLEDLTRLANDLEKEALKR